MKLGKLDAKKLAQGCTIEVNLPIKIDRMREFRIRTTIALWLISLATAISWVQIEVVEKCEGR